MLIHPVDKDCLLGDLKEYIEYLERENNKLSEENKKLKDEHYKDEELQTMKDKVDEANQKLYEVERRSFGLTEDEQKQVDEFISQHSHYFGAIGGGFTYTFTPTSIGEIGKVTCADGSSLVFRQP